MTKKSDIKVYGLGYQGSKRRLMKKYLPVFEQVVGVFDVPRHLNVPFMGGGSCAYTARAAGWSVTAGEILPHIAALHNAITGVDPNEHAGLSSYLESPWFVSREDFFLIRDNPQDFPDWYVGLVLCVFSFGNDGRTYMYGKKIESLKYAGHVYAVEGNTSQLAEILGDSFAEQLPLDGDTRSRRLALARVAREFDRKPQHPILNRVQQLEHLEHLEHPERLQHLERLEVATCSYEELPMTNGIVYCDPPYANTAGYGGASFDHGEFWEWAKKMSNTMPILVSEYTAPDGWLPLLESEITINKTNDGNHRKAKEVLWIPEWQHEAYERHTAGLCN